MAKWKVTFWFVIETSSYLAYLFSTFIVIWSLELQLGSENTDIFQSPLQLDTAVWLSSRKWNVSESDTCTFQKACSPWNVDVVAVGTWWILELPRNSGAVGKRSFDRCHHGPSQCCWLQLCICLPWRVPFPGQLCEWDPIEGCSAHPAQPHTVVQSHLRR